MLLNAERKSLDRRAWTEVAKNPRWMAVWKLKNVSYYRWSCRILVGSWKRKSKGGIEWRKSKGRIERKNRRKVKRVSNKIFPVTSNACRIRRIHLGDDMCEPSQADGIFSEYSTHARGRVINNPWLMLARAVIGSLCREICTERSVTGWATQQRCELYGAIGPPFMVLIDAVLTQTALTFSLFSHRIAVGGQTNSSNNYSNFE